MKNFNRNNFEYIKTKSNYISYYKDGKWDRGKLQKEDEIKIAITSTSLHYGQEAFEGMKAYKCKDGSINLFRPEENAKRFIRTCERMMIPEVPITKFLEAVIMTVKDNYDYIPEYGTNSSLYIRPYIIGIGDNIGVKPSSEYIFGVIVTPVGSYFDITKPPLRMVTSEFDRAAPNGTGHVKVGGNYGGSLYPKYIAKKMGFDDCIYLDPKTHSKFEETGAANFFVISDNNEYITPESRSILASITNNSLKRIASDIFKMTVIEKDIHINDLEGIIEAGACGTAAVVTPIGSITHQNKTYKFKYYDEIGVVTKKLYDTLTQIQYSEIKDPFRWIHKIETK